MNIPQVREQHQKLHKLAGKWVGEDILYPTPWNPQRSTATTTVTLEVNLDGFFVIGGDVQEQNGKTVFLAHKVYGFDDATNTYTFHFFDSLGANPTVPARGTWEGDTLVLNQETPRGDVQYVYVFESDNRYRFHMDLNGQRFIEGIYNRVPTA